MPPVVTTPAAVQYPAAAIAERHFVDAEVALIVDIDRDGAVTRATPVAPVGHGFDEAAVAAAMTLRFAPATRDGAPIASRIRYRFAFRPPPARLSGRVVMLDGDGLAGTVRITLADGSTRQIATGPDGRWSVADLGPGEASVVVSSAGFTDDAAELTLEHGQETSLVTRLVPIPLAAPGAAGGAPAAQEVNVVGTKPPREVTRRTLSRDEIDKIPGTNGDALRSIQSLPGVARPPPFNGLLIVRGSVPGETTTFIDGTPVPLVYHFGGLSSVVPTESLDRIDFYPGNYGATYGRGTAGMVDVALRAPKKELHGFAQVDLIDLRLLVEGPIGHTGWTFLASGRRSWFDTWLVPVLEQATAGVSTAPRYHDYQLMLRKELGARSSLRVTFFGSDDAFAIGLSRSDAAMATAGGSFDNQTRFYRLQAVYTDRYSDTGELRAVVAAGRDQDQIGVGNLFMRSSEYPFSLRTEVSQRLSSRIRAHAGVDLVHAPYDILLRLPPDLQPGDPPFGSGAQPIASRASGDRTFAGVYTELEVVPWRGGRVVPGVRLDHTSTTREWDVSPRVNIRHDLVSGVPRTTLKGGSGLFYQPPSALETDPGYGQAGLRSTRAAHHAAGFEQQFTEHLELSVEAFGKTLDRVVVQGAGNTGQGRAYGTETSFRFRGHPRFFGWIAYTLSRSERRDGAREPWRAFQYDQTHNLTAVGSYTLGRGFRLGGRFRLISGNLYTPMIGGGFDASAGTYASASQVPGYGSRLPYFHQLDVRLDKVWTFASWRLTAYLDVQNVYNYAAKEGRLYNFNYTASALDEGLPILPSVGLRGEL